MGEHLPCKQGVMSSNLTISIRFRKKPTRYIENCISKVNDNSSEMMIVRHPNYSNKNLFEKTNRLEVATLGN